MDILLDSNGDLYISPKGDIVLKNSVAQKIRIKLLWLEGEWKWNREEGLPYRESLFVKNPDIDYFAGIVRQKIFEVEEIIEVKEVAIDFDKKTRGAVIRYVALTDFETLREEVKLIWEHTE